MVSVAGEWLVHLLLQMHVGGHLLNSQGAEKRGFMSMLLAVGRILVPQAWRIPASLLPGDARTRY